jgi:hypothetical protein
MDRRTLVALLPAAGLATAQERRRPRPRSDPKKPPDLLMVELRVERGDKTITVDGRVRNNSIKPLDGVVLFFEFLEPGGKMISRMIAQVTDAPVPPGDEGEFLTQTPDQVRAVHVRVDAEDAKGRYLVLDKPGPHVIE